MPIDTLSASPDLLSLNKKTFSQHDKLVHKEVIPLLETCLHLKTRQHKLSYPHTKHTKTKKNSDNEILLNEIVANRMFELFPTVVSTPYIKEDFDLMTEIYLIDNKINLVGKSPNEINEIANLICQEQANLCKIVFECFL